MDVVDSIFNILYGDIKGGQLIKISNIDQVQTVLSKTPSNNSNAKALWTREMENILNKKIKRGNVLLYQFGESILYVELFSLYDYGKLGKGQNGYIPPDNVYNLRAFYIGYNY